MNVKNLTASSRTTDTISLYASALLGGFLNAKDVAVLVACYEYVATLLTPVTRLMDACVYATLGRLADAIWAVMQAERCYASQRADVDDWRAVLLSGSNNPHYARRSVLLEDMPVDFEVDELTEPAAVGYALEELGTLFVEPTRAEAASVFAQMADGFAVAAFLTAVVLLVYEPLEHDEVVGMVWVREDGQDESLGGDGEDVTEPTGEITDLVDPSRWVEVPLLGVPAVNVTPQELPEQPESLPVPTPDYEDVQGWPTELAGNTIELPAPGVDKLTYKELQAVAKQLGVKANGKHADLLERVRAALREEAA